MNNENYSDSNMEEGIFIFILGTRIVSFFTTIGSLFVLYFYKKDTDNFYVPIQAENGGALEVIWIYSGIIFLVTLGLVFRACKVAKHKAELAKKRQADQLENWKRENNF